METKVCFKCGVDKPLDEFYKHKKMADGHLGKCKECTKRDTSEHAKTPAGRAVARRREQTLRRRKWHREYQRRRVQDPLKRRARWMVCNAIRDKRLKRGACEVCGKKKRVEAHHEDYYRPLDVKWLCPKHHKELHRCSKVN